MNKMEINMGELQHLIYCFNLKGITCKDIIKDANYWGKYYWEFRDYSKQCQNGWLYNKGGTEEEKCWVQLLKAVKECKDNEMIMNAFKNNYIVVLGKEEKDCECDLELGYLYYSNNNFFIIKYKDADSILIVFKQQFPSIEEIELAFEHSKH